MPKTKTLIPVYFLTKDNKIEYQYVTPLELYKIYHWRDNLNFVLQFKTTYNLSNKSIISYDLDKVEKKYDDENLKGYTKLIQDEHINTIKPDNYDDLIFDASKVLHYCIDIYGNIVEVFVPNDKINDKKYWIEQAQQYKLLCDFYYSPFHYSSKNKKLEEVKKEMAKKICGKTTVYCFYDTEMEGEYYKCYGIKFPVEEKEEKEGDLKTIEEKPLEVVENDFPKVKIYYKKEIEERLKRYFTHKTIFTIGDTKIDLAPSKEKMDELNSLPECKVDIGYSPNKENPKTEFIALIDSNKAKSHSGATSEEFIARITIDINKDYGKVIEVQFGRNEKTDKEYTAEEARQLLLANCAKTRKNLAKSIKESFLDLILIHPDYYKTEDCPVRLPNCSQLIIGEWSREGIEKEVKLCTDNLSDNCNMIIPMAKKYPNSTYHMFVIVATKKNDEISFKIFDPSTALKLENKEELKQKLGDYIYDHLDKEYILSPDTPI